MEPLAPFPSWLFENSSLACSRRAHPPPVSSHTKCSFKSFCGSQLLQKSVNLSLTITYMKNKLTDLCGNYLLQDDFHNTLCEMTPFTVRARLPLCTSCFTLNPPPSLKHRPSMGARAAGTREREFFIDNLLVRIHFSIVMILVDWPRAVEA